MKCKDEVIVSSSADSTIRIWNYKGITNQHNVLISDNEGMVYMYMYSVRVRILKKTPYNNGFVNFGSNLYD